MALVCGNRYAETGGMSSPHLFPKPRDSPTIALVRQDSETSIDPETPHPLRIYFVNAEVTS